MTNCVEYPAPCTGCGVCRAVCPAGAISLKVDAEGFWTAVLNKAQCIGCRKCLCVCPKIEQNFPASASFDSLPLYALHSQDPAEQASSSSGAIAAEITKWAFANGYKAAGVIYNYQRQCAETVIAETPAEAVAFKGSKYLQSDSAAAFEQILKRKDKLVVFGTPCQIAALHLAAQAAGRRNELVLVDFFCHGVPSYGLWKAFLEQQPAPVKQIHFRSKRRGWHSYTMEINGQTIPQAQNPFYALFFSDLLLGRACYACASRKSFAFADIRLGDFWGSPFDLREDGISAVCAISAKGREIISALMAQKQLVALPANHTVCQRAQAAFRDTPLRSDRRDFYLRRLAQKTPLTQLWAQYQRGGGFFKKYAKRFLFSCPRIAGLVRYFFHRSQGY